MATKFLLLAAIFLVSAIAQDTVLAEIMDAEEAQTISTMKVVDSNWATHKTTPYKGQTLKDNKGTVHKYAGVFRRGLGVTVQFGPVPTSAKQTDLTLWLQDDDDAVELPATPGSFKREGTTVTLTGVIPANFPIGLYGLVACHGDDCLSLDDWVAVLFDPYKSDLNQVDAAEYIERPIGAAYYPESVIPWTYNHHKILPAVAKYLYLPGNNMPVLTRAQRASETDVVRFFTNVIADQVLVGNWNLPDTKAAGQTYPQEWRGSEEIWVRNFQTNKPVEWGQCWVFAGLFTGALRALGIPARPVTNVGSAHEHHPHNAAYDKVIELVEKYQAKGMSPTAKPLKAEVLPPVDSAIVQRALRSAEVPLNLQFSQKPYIFPAPKCQHKDKEYKMCFGKAGQNGAYSQSDCFCVALAEDADSAWNFHVWTEAYINRDGKYEWNAADATWQEPSYWLKNGAEVYAMGPAKMSEVASNLDKSYDAAFVTSETNARQFNTLGINKWFDRAALKTYPSVDPATKRYTFLDGQYARNMYTRLPGCAKPWLTYKSGAQGGAKGHCALDLRGNYVKRPHGLALIEAEQTQTETNLEAAFEAAAGLTKRLEVPSTGAQFTISATPGEFEVGKDVTFKVSHSLKTATKVHYTIFVSVQDYKRKQMGSLKKASGLIVLDSKNANGWFSHTVKVADYLKWVNRKFSVVIFVSVKKAPESAPAPVHDAVALDAASLESAKAERKETLKAHNERRSTLPTKDNKASGKFVAPAGKDPKKRSGDQRMITNAYQSADEVLYMGEYDIEVMRPALALRLAGSTAGVKPAVDKSKESKTAANARAATAAAPRPSASRTAPTSNVVPAGNNKIEADIVFAEIESETETEAEVEAEIEEVAAAESQTDMASLISQLQIEYPHVRFAEQAIGVFQAGQTINIEAELQNPFKALPLTNLVLSYTGPSGIVKIPVAGSIPAGGSWKHTMNGISVGHLNALTGVSVTLSTKAQNTLVAFRGSLEFKVEGEVALPAPASKAIRKPKPVPKQAKKAPAKAAPQKKSAKLSLGKAKL